MTGFRSSSKTLRQVARSLASSAVVAALFLTGTRAEIAAEEGIDAAESRTLPGALELEKVSVVGSHIRRSAIDGPSPVSIYDRDFIEATGAMRLADFLNLLPQNYTGSGSGRGSAPNDSNPDSGVRTESTYPSFNYAMGSSNVPLGQSGVSGANLRGLGSGSTLVLVDGRRRPIAGQGNMSTDSRQGFVDLNLISLGMIERIEVLADGASAIYGSDAIGGVINVVLKKNYTGAELTTSYRGTFDGGGRERRVTLSGGFTSGDARLRGMLSIDLYDRSALTAAQRDFSANQDHGGIVRRYDADGAPVYGLDLRLNWGYPAVVQARSGTLNGVTAPDGTPTAFALVPAGARATPGAADFTGVAATSATGLQQTNTAAFLNLVSPQETRSIGGSVEYDLGEAMFVYAGFSDSDVRGRFDAQPPVSMPSATSGFGNFATLVPAMIDGRPNEHNPFAQDVLVGLVHEEFGPVRQTTRSRHRGVFAGVTGVVAARWTWDASVSWSRDRSAQQNRTLDGAAFAAALTASDPAQRFNPFIDARGGTSPNAALYPAMAVVDRYEGSSELTVSSLVVDGPLFSLSGGEVEFATGGEYATTQHRSMARPASGAATGVDAQREGHAVFAELFVPVVGEANAMPLVRRFNVQLATRYQDNGRAGRSTDPKIGAAWTLVPAVMFRAGVSRGFRAPALTEYQTPQQIFVSTLTDPRRTPSRTTAVSLRYGSNPVARPETSEHVLYGMIFKPAFITGLTLSIDYHRSTQDGALQDISPQTIVNNEAAFGDRITRAAATAEDVALGQPGAITAVDATFVNFGTSHHENLDFALNYDVPARRFGHVRINFSGTHGLAARTLLRPGTPVDLEGDTSAPPRWRWMGLVAWQGGAWNAAVFANHVGGFESNNAGNLMAPEGSRSMTVVNVRIGRRFDRGFWGGFARGAKVGVGIGNVFDRDPPFSDTVFGYNGGLHTPLGRNYDVSLTLPF